MVTWINTDIIILAETHLTFKESLLISTLRIQLEFSSKVCSAPHLLCHIIDRMVSQVALVVKNPLANAGDIGDSGLIPGEEMATQSSILAWRIPGTEGPVEVKSMGSQRVRHN